MGTRITQRRSHRSLAVAVVVVACSTVLSTRPAVALSVTNACETAASPGSAYQDIVGIVGTAPASVAAGASFALTGISVSSLDVPSLFFVAAYNAGLLTSGQTVPGTVQLRIEATNTVQGIQTTPAVNVNIGPISIFDPDGIPGNGDESATLPHTSVNFPNQTWNAGASGTISFREDTLPLGANSGGIIITVSLGPLNVQVRCSPGTVVGGNETLTDPAAPFAVTENQSSPGGSCGGAPASGCVSPGKSILMIKDKDEDGAGPGDKLIWKWLKGPATPQSAFGDPTVTADYTLCIYDGAGAVAVAADVDAGGPNWSAISTKGYKYVDPTSALAGISNILLNGHPTAAKSKILWKGKNDVLPIVPASLPLDATSDIVVQAINSDNANCWEASFAPATVITNTEAVFKAKTPP